METRSQQYLETFLNFLPEHVAKNILHSVQITFVQMSITPTSAPI